jgi:hypothetical protein
MWGEIWQEWGGWCCCVCLKRLPDVAVEWQALKISQCTPAIPRDYIEFLMAPTGTNSILRSDAISLFFFTSFFSSRQFSQLFWPYPILVPLSSIGLLTEVFHFILSQYHTVIFPCEVGAKIWMSEHNRKSEAYNRCHGINICWMMTGFLWRFWKKLARERETKNKMEWPTECGIIQRVTFFHCSQNAARGSVCFSCDVMGRFM